MLKRPDGTVITPEYLKKIRESASNGFSCTVPARVTGMPCAADAGVDSNFYLGPIGIEVCCWCGVARDKHCGRTVGSEILLGALGSLRMGRRR